MDKPRAEFGPPAGTAPEGQRRMQELRRLLVEAAFDGCTVEIIDHTDGSSTGPMSPLRLAAELSPPN